jgi:hypothetical protein
MASREEKLCKFPTGRKALQVPNIMIPRISNGNERRTSELNAPMFFSESL